MEGQLGKKLSLQKNGFIKKKDSFFAVRVNSALVKKILSGV
jgi:hypothetical protein